MSVRTCIALVAGCVALSAAAQIPEQYPKPLLHTAMNHPADRVVIVRIDGMRAINLANFVASHPQSALAELTRRGVTYTNAHVPWPDTAAGMMAIATGGSPISTGIFSSEGYDRALQRETSGCDAGPAVLNLAAGRAELVKAQGDCAAVEAHRLVHVNSLFDLVHDAGGATAWADANASNADLLRGASGKALDEVFVPSLKSAGEDELAAAEQQDSQRVDAVVRWLSAANAPRLCGLTLMGLEAGQRSVPLTQTAKLGAASSAKRSPMEHLDAEVGRIIAALKAKKLFDSTWIVVTAAHGSLGDTANLRVVDAALVHQVATSTAGDEVARVSTGTVALIWLKTPAMTVAVVNAYRAKMLSLGIGAIAFGEKLKLLMNTAADDSRMPDVILEPQTGVVWSEDGKWPEHLGGFGDDENHVAMLISGRQLTGRVDKTPVPTSQVAPLLLRALGMEKFGLEALHREHVPALPGIF